MNTMVAGGEMNARIAVEVMNGRWIRGSDADYANPDSSDGRVHAFVILPEQFAFFLCDDRYVEDTGECPRDHYGWIPDKKQCAITTIALSFPDAGKKE